jgi:hypothetical protein
MSFFFGCGRGVCELGEGRGREMNRISSHMTEGEVELVVVAVVVFPFSKRVMTVSVSLGLFGSSYIFGKVFFWILP